MDFAAFSFVFFVPINYTYLFVSCRCRIKVPNFVKHFEVTFQIPESERTFMNLKDFRLVSLAIITNKRRPYDLSPYVIVSSSKRSTRSARAAKRKLQFIATMSKS